MTMAEKAKTIENFRSQVPPLADENVTFLNSSFQPPMNKIVSNAIETYVQEGLYGLNPKPTWIAQCENVRSNIARHLNADPDDMVFTRDTTESCNLFQRLLKFKSGNNVVLLRGEHPNQTSGCYNANTFADAVDANTIAIGISSVMFHSGLRNDIKSICDLYRPKGIHVLVDATQEVGFGKIDVKSLGVSALAFGIHKGLACPTGLGLLYIDPMVLSDLKATPPIMSAGSLSNIEGELITPVPFTCFESAKRFEHLNKAVLQCLVLGKYLDFINSVGIENIQEHLENLGLYLRSELGAIGVKTVGPNNKKLRSPQSNVLELKSPEWLPFFIENCVYVSQYRGRVRASLGLYNSKDDVDKFVDIVRKGLDAGLQ
ncbi:hypothetical protein PMKS-003032 [Pichia membranifaciens]|uniref:Aminotransferase class V domain-containing protein n=1 Tax=Pichia membranifaciens TaxID=4926 RepID=A0A1Q2YJ81_9ASCO|nr:hypothetical protein PMKS-003032 [Pichia membranifaciens]